MSIWAFPSFYPFDQPGMRSSGIFAHRQYKGLIENGADLKVVIPVPWHPPFPLSSLHSEWKQYSELNYPAIRVYEGVTIYYPRIYNMRPNRYVKKSFVERTIDAIIDFFKENNIQLDPANDIFYSQWTPNSAIVQQAAHILGVKSGILCIGDDVILFPHDKPESREVFKKTWKEADLRFVVADHLGKEANKIAGVNIPYDVVFMGVDYDNFKPSPAAYCSQIKKEYKIPGDKKIILTIGTAIKRKGWIDLFDALEQVKKSTNDFFLVGIRTGTPDIDFLKEVEKRGLTEFFLDLDGISPDLLNRIYNTADIFCLPSHSEGMANVVIEAMSSGLPVVTTDVPGHMEIIKSGVNGILVPPRQPEILARELLSLINDNDKRSFLRRNARDFIVNTWGNFTDNTKLLYAKLSAAINAPAEV